jgi:hypothetical protein
MSVGDDSHILGAGRAPTPFTADEIRRGCPEGRTIRLLVEPDGADPVVRVNRYIQCDADGATIERSVVTADGEQPGDSGRSSWLELQAHASFPADQPAVANETAALPLGTLECHRYTVRDGDAVDEFWFALAMPGMPVKVTNARDGRIAVTVTAIADSTAPRSESDTCQS